MRKLLFLVSAVAVLCSCSKEEDVTVGTFTSEITGAYINQNKIIYSDMNYNYLWRTDMPDSLSCDYNLDPASFYKSLLSSKDRFSYLDHNTSYSSSSSSTRCAELGFEYQSYLDNEGNEYWQVLYVTASDMKGVVSRGDILKVISSDSDGATLQKGTFVDNTFVASAESFEAATRTVYTSNETVYMDSIYTVNDRKVGYLCYLQFEDCTDLIPSMKKFKEAGITDLVLDLRYNPGGYVLTEQYLCDCIVPEAGYGQIFQQFTFNDRVSADYFKEYGSEIEKTYFDKPTDDVKLSVDDEDLSTPIYPLQLPKMYVLTSENTASASESTVMSLRPFMNVTLIGETTVGKGVSSISIVEDSCKYYLQPIVANYYNANMETTPETGLTVDYEISGGYNTSASDLGSSSEPLLAKALELISGNTSSSAKSKATRSSIPSILTENGSPSFVAKHNSRHKATNKLLE